MAWRWEFLRKIKKLRAEGYTPVYLDETWFDSHETVSRLLSDGSKSCSLRGPVSRGKRIVIAHAGTSNGFIPGSLHLCGKKLSDAFADYHQDMNANVFENWFLEKLIPNLPEKSVVILDNASYHCRQVDKTPNMNTRKAEMLDFMKRNSITVPEPLPTKPVLLERIKMTNIQKKFAIDSTAFENGHLVLRLPPYHCCLNAIELVWHQLKSKVRRQNVYADQPEKVLQLIKESCDEITGEHWYIEHVMNEELRFRERDNFLDNEIESVVVDLTDNESDDDIYEHDVLYEYEDDLE